MLPITDALYREALGHYARDGDWKAIVPRWLYDRGVKAYGEGWMSRQFTPVDDFRDGKR